MKNQFIKLYSWMLEFGLTAQELIAFALIHAYTVFKGCFDGDPIWLSKWLCVDTEEVDTALERLIKKGLVYSYRSRWGTNVYKVCVFGGSAGSKKSGSSNTVHNIDINNIDIDIDKKNKDTIDIDYPIDIDIEKEIKYPIDIDIENVFKDPIDIDINSIDMQTQSKEEPIENKSDPEPDPKPVPGRQMLGAEFMESLAPYDDLSKVPLDLLARKIGEYNEKLANKMTIND